MKIQDFRAALNRNQGVQRQHRWRVIVNYPSQAASGETILDTTLLAQTATLPPSTIGEIMVPWGGRELPLPGDRKFEPYPITFVGVQSDAIHAAFESWSELINGTASNAMSSDLTELMRDIELQLLDDQDNTIRSYILQGAWPQEVGAVELDQTAQDSHTTFTVTFRYIQHEHDKTL